MLLDGLLTLLRRLVALLVVGAASAQAAEPVVESGDDLVVMLVTFSPGDDVTSWFGHSALVVENRKTRDARLYNYGEFSFDDTLLVRYALGRLEFWVGERPVEQTLELYRRQRRSIGIQELALTPSQRLETAAFLRNNALPEHRGYLYDHFTDNCATRPRDVIDLVTGGRLRAAAAGPGRLSLREHTRRHTARNPVLAVLIDFVMNSDVDRPLTRWEEAFLPAELAALVADADDGDGHGLVARAFTDFQAPERAAPPAQAPRSWPGMLGIGTGVAVVAWRVRRTRRLLGALSALVGFVVGVPGLVLLIMWTCTDHLVAHDNENVLLANPLTLMGLPLGVAWALGSQRAGRGLRVLWPLVALLALGGLALKALPGFDQDNWNILALVVPAVVALGVAVRRGPVDPAAGGRRDAARD